ncbi:WASP homolog-associated protein with actin, membranes and microtubules-like [Rhopalosiphum padi]|uniref:WASP homolog-associated protein with actin, membranes and microtubules-like n=1 Tax=Rhopalosiphum padi TaxID=40932 RepID=UPI00298EC1E5|nr:WASP homolog-associated protein with actin, membranes and microtubules-like [Rhopalosiphum padi]
MHYLIISFLLGVIVMYGIFKRKHICKVLYRILQNYLKAIIYYDKIYKNTEVQVDLTAVKDTVYYIDNKTLKEEFERMKEKNLVLEKRLTELSDMVRHGEEKQISSMSRCLQLRQYEESVQCLHDKVDKLYKDQRTVTETIDDKLRRLVCEIASIKSCYYTSYSMFHDFEKKLTSIKSDTENSIRKCRSLKSWNETLERDVMKNTLNISALSLELASCHEFGSTRMPSPDNHGCSRPDTFGVSVVSNNKFSVPKPPDMNLVPTTPFPPPPPPAPKAARNMPKPMNTATGEKVYYRIPITTDILKSVVLKPPGERNRKH